MSMLIAPLIREPGRVVSKGRVLVPTPPNFNDQLFTSLLEIVVKVEEVKI
jgi:hypothetical protein